MSLPQQIQRQVDAANAMLEATNASAPEAPAPTPGPGDQPPATPPVEATAEVPAAPPAPPSPAPAPTASEEKTWEQRFKTLQGLHNSNIADLKARLNAANAQTEALTARLEAMTAKPAEKSPQLDPKDAEMFGDDMVDMVKRVAETMFGSAVSAFDTRIAALEQRLDMTASTTSRTAEEVFYDRLGSMVPDYEAINADEGFLAWLAEVDPVYGLPRQAALDNAAKAMDVARVARVFQAFKAMSAPVPAASPAPSAQLEKQLAPQSAASAPPRQPTQKSFMTVAEVQAFYRDVQTGKYTGREKEAAAREAAINLALAEGRIVDRAPRLAPV